MTKPQPTDVVVVGAARTPFTKFRGALSSLTAPQLASHAIRAALEQGSVPAEAVDAVHLGQVLSAGVGQNPAKQAALGAGISPNAHTSIVNKVCLSGLTAIIDSARLLRSGEARAVVAGGMESMSQAPHLIRNTRTGTKYGELSTVDHIEYDGLRAADTGISMGELTEKDADRYPATREEQDRCAALSHQRAKRAHSTEWFAKEVAPVTVETRRSTTVVDSDEGVRDNVTEESLSDLRPVFAKEGTITAGNSSPLSDGAAAVVLCTAETAEEEGWTPLATLRAVGQVAGPDSSLQAQPANALQAALDRQGWLAEDLDHIEINEAFAAVVVHSAHVLGVEVDEVNPQGGAIAIGHPIGASGARLVVHAVHQLAKANIERAGVGLCGGGGQGEAILLEAE